MTQNPLYRLATQNGSDNSSLLRTLIDSLPEQVYVKDTEGRYLLNNTGHARALGAESPEKIAGKSDFDFYPRKFAERYRANEQEIVRSGKPLVDKEEPSVDGEGKERWHSTTKVPLRDESGKIVGLVGITRDVTERTEAEEVLRESEDRFRSLTNAAFEGIAITENGEILEANQAFADMYGYELSEVQGMSALEFHALEIRDEVWQKISSGYDQPYESKGLKKDGTTFDVEIRGKTTRYGGHSVRVAALRDITERKEAEEKLKESEERFRSAFEDAPIGVALVGLDGRRFRVNRALCEMLGYTEEELCSEKYIEHIHPGDHEISTEHFRRTLEEGVGTYTLERRYLHADGHTVWNLTSVSLIQDSQGNPSHLVCLHQDITERKDAEEKLRESEERFRSLVRNATDLITVLEEDGTILYESPTIERILGYLPEERIGKNAFDYLHPDDEDRSKATFAEALDNPGHVQPPVEVRLRHKDGSWRYMETTRTNLLNDPAVKGVVANSRDTTERRQTEEALKESEERYRAVMEQSAEAIWLFDPTSKQVLESNTTFQEMFGYTAEELRGMTNYDFVTHSRQNIDSAIQRIVQERKGFFGERKYRRKDGMVLDVEVSGSVIPYDSKEVVCAVARDLTERKELEEQLRHQAFHDPLTELPNRALFLDRIGHALARARREDGPVAVLLLDLNDFKAVNDSLGHDAGNAVLVEIAKRLRTRMRPGDTPGRIFGDEFAVLLEAPSGMEEASRVADRLQEGLQEPFDVDGREVFVSASIGIALGESKAQPKEVLRHADLAMYEAKRRGRVEYEVYKPSMNTRAVNRMDLQNELRRAVESEEFEVHYQPLIELETDSVAGFEALARWRHPERGLVDAEEFIELVEETGLIRPIGQRVLEEACRQAKEWRERYLEDAPWMSVNFSASQLSRQPDLIPKVLDEIGLEPTALQLEITERAVMDNAEYSIGKLKKLKGLGVSFAIDDYGMGYSCLYYLKRMPVDFLKIDRSFITGLGQDRGDEAIVFGTIGLAHALNLRVVAEGVETEEQLAKLKELGCDLAQGFYLAEPLPSEDVEKLLQERDSF